MAFNLHEVALKEKITMPQKGFDESSLGTSWSSSERSSSSLSSPFGSELGSINTESEDEDFMAELTCLMANYMLEDDDDDDEEESRAPDSFSENTEPCGLPAKWPCGCNSTSAKWCGCNSTSVYYCDQRLMISTSTEPAALSTPSAQGKMQSVEVYELKNQPAVKEAAGYSWTESANKQFNTQQLQQKRQQHYKQNKGRGHGGKGLSSQNGSGTMMRAIFLGGSGSRNGSCGTGVFLPRVIDNQTTQHKKRPGCSTVLVPAKVLQALELHFNNMDALSKSNGCGGDTNHSRQGASQQKRNSELHTAPASNHQEMLVLPEEWTY